MPLIIDRTGWHFVWLQNAMRYSDAVIVLAKRRCLVDNTSTVRIRNVSIDNDPESFVFILQKVNISAFPMGEELTSSVKYSNKGT